MHWISCGFPDLISYFSSNSDYSLNKLEEQLFLAIRGKCYNDK